MQLDKRHMWRRTGLLAGLLLGGVSVAQTAPKPDPLQIAATDEVCVIAPQIAAEIAKLPANASQEDYEGAILFAVSQVTCGTPAVVAALEAMLKDPTLGAIERKALESVIEQLNRRGRGTAAIDSGGGGFGNDGFGSPVVPIGGGSSTYTA